MQKNTLFFVVLALIVGLAVGFSVANYINRSEMRSTVPQKSANPSNSNSQQPKEETDLTDDELNAKIAKADKNPDDFTYQKNLGTALYQYATVKNDPSLLQEAVRILDRANSLNAKDFDVLVALGNAHFDIGFANKDTAQYKKAREVYTSALELKPGDPNVSTDLGLTYFLQEPPSYDKAAAQLQKVSDANPTHTRSLQFLVRVLVKQNKISEAEKTLAKLKSIDPNYDAIPDLTSEIAASQKGEK